MKDYFFKYCCKLLILLGFIATFSAAYAQDEIEEEDDFFFFEEGQTFDDEIADPFEPINRVVFTINDRLFRAVLSPVVKTYRLVPRPVRASVSNFYSNLTTPLSAVNAVLQLDVPNAGSELSRFIVNSTIGILGFFDPATRLGIEEDREDFGQTLGHYGVGHGFYIVLPILSFSSFRDLGSRVGNSLLNPINHIWDPELDDYIAFQTLDEVNDLSFNVDNYTSLYDSALDPYAFFRSAYVQVRAGDVNK
tara:strand:- start:3041 stop:3787 length:747 start_codon:yes stop_codon:yes gene_type:complete